MRNHCIRALAIVLCLFITLPPHLLAQQQGPVFKQEELEQILAPIALYPDSLVAQILMASTYPLEVVQADRFAKQNASLKGDALTNALEGQSWDPSVKSLVNFPQVLTMMSEKLDWTQKLGDAFLSQQKEVMDTVQTLRQKAQEAGHLKTTQEQKVIVQEKVIVIESASPQVVYVPAYNPTVVYGVWAYPAYPPYYYYPPGYVAARSAFWFATGVAVGAAWGYAWGGCRWGRGHVDIDINRNVNINRNINRNNYVRTMPANGSGQWQHNPQHRKGVNYRDPATAQRYNRGASSQAVQSREAFRGRAAEGRQALNRGDGAQARNQVARSGQGQGAARDRAGAASPGGQAATRDRAQSNQARQSAGQDRGGAFKGVDRGGASARNFSERGSSSRAASARGASRGGGRRR